MKFKVDENLPLEVASLLEENGHHSVTVSEQNLGGEPDIRIADVCRMEKRALITLDTDFSDIRTYPPNDYHGLVVLRLRKQDKTHVLSVLSQLMDILRKEPIDHHLWIVEEEKVRISGGGVDPENRTKKH